MTKAVKIYVEENFSLEKYNERQIFYESLRDYFFMSRHRSQSK